MTTKEAIKVITNTPHEYGDYDTAAIMAVEALEEVERHNETFEFCTDCKEYDHKNHCCHRWTKQIRDTLEDVKQATSDKTSDKYRWHDLRKNQYDLPESKRVVYVLARMKCKWDGKYRLYQIQMIYSSKIMYGKAVGWGVSYPYDFNFETDEVIAWREIEPFEKIEV